MNSSNAQDHTCLYSCEQGFEGSPGVACKTQHVCIKKTTEFWLNSLSCGYQSVQKLISLFHIVNYTLQTMATSYSIHTIKYLQYSKVRQCFNIVPTYSFLFLSPPRSFFQQCSKQKFTIGIIELVLCNRFFYTPTSTGNIQEFTAAAQPVTKLLHPLLLL